MLRGVMVAATIAVGPAVLGAQSTVRTFRLMAGADTVSVEEVTRSPGRLEGHLLFPRGNQRWHYVATLGPSGEVLVFENDFRLASDTAGSAPRQRGRFTFLGDSVFISFDGPTPPPQRIGTKRGAMPFLNPSFGLMEQAVLRRRHAGSDSLAVVFFAVAAGQSFPTVMVPLGLDSIVVTLAGTPARFALAADGTITGGAFPSQGMTLDVARGAAGRFLAMSKPDYSAPADAPYTAESVTIPTPGGHRLAGTLTLPRGVRGRLPAVVTITGSGSQDRDEAIPAVKGYRPFRDLADALGRRGVAVLRMDDRGFGESEAGPGTPTSLDSAEDIRAGLAYLRGRSEIDGNRLGLIGHSEGGLIAPLVASTDSGLRGIVLLAGPGYTGRKILEFQNRYALERAAEVPPAVRDSILKAAVRTLDSLGTVQPWMKFFLEYDPLLTARKVRTPVLILQGATDQQVTADQAALLERAFTDGGNPDVTMEIYPATNHLFLADADGNPSGYSALKDVTLNRRMLRTLVDWVVKRLAR